MEQYISKSALVAEIIRRRKAIPKEEDDKRLKAVYGNEAFVLTELLEYIDTLEAKEVDINKEISQFIDANFEKATIGHKLSLRRTAKYFFELGMTASNKAQEGE